MKSVLITGIGGDIAQSVARILREKWPSWRLCGSDTHDQHAGKSFVDDFFLLPSASDPTYVDAIRDIYTSQKIDVFVPMSESELAILGSFMDELGADHCISAGTSTISVGLDKLKQTESQVLEMQGSLDEKKK